MTTNNVQYTLVFSGYFHEILFINLAFKLIVLTM